MLPCCLGVTPLSAKRYFESILVEISVTLNSSDSVKKNL